MAQVNLYVDETLLQQVREAAHEQELSLSGYVRKLLAEAVASDPGWPADYENLLGSVGEGELSCPKRLSAQSDVTRDEF